MSTNEGIIKEKNVQLGDAACSLKIGPLYQGLKRYCHFLTQNQWDSDDLVQEAILKAVKHYPLTEFTPALLNKIAYHQWIDMVRKGKREVVGIDQETVDITTDSEVDSLMETVKTLVDRLTAKQVVIFTLKEGFRFQLKEIAGLLNTSEVAVKSTLYRARQTLARKNEIHPIQPISDKNESLLYDLLYKSLQANNPQVLIEQLKKIASFVEVSVQEKPKPIQTSLNVYSLAA